MNLHEKLVEIRKTCDFLKKDKEGFQFKYVSSSQALGALRAKMDELGVLLVPSVRDVRVTDHVNAKGGHEFFTELWFDFTWINAEKPEDRFTVVVYGQGIDTGEKGVGKAMTYAEKYHMLKIFNIPTDKDDPDADQKPEAQKPEAKKPADKPAAPAKADKKTLESIVNIFKSREAADPANIKSVCSQILGYDAPSSSAMTQEQADIILAALRDPDKVKELIPAIAA